MTNKLQYCISLVVFLAACNLSAGSIKRKTKQGVLPEETKLTRVKIPVDTPRPKYLKPIVDPLFKTHIIRISDADALKSKRKVIRHNYSKRQAFNADGTLVMLGNKYLLDGKTFKLVGTYSAPSSECFWSNKKPRLMYAFDPRKKQLITIDVKKNKHKVLYKFKGYEQVFMGRWEGNMSIDDKYVAFMGKKGKDLYIITFNIKARKIVTVKKFPGMWEKEKSPNIDWVSFSQSGKYVLINWDNRGSSRLCGIEVYDKKMKFLRQLTECGEHGDIGYDTGGNEVFVQVTCGARSKYKGEIISLRLKDGKVTRIIDSSLGGFGGHISCRNTKRPGWAYVSTAAPLFEVFAVKLDGSQTVQRFTHTHSSTKVYSAEAQAVPNRYGDKVIFASHWDVGKEIYSYVTYMPKHPSKKNR